MSGGEGTIYDCLNIFTSVKAQRLLMERVPCFSRGSRGFVYIIEHPPYAKIGYSKDPERRLYALQISSPTEMRLACVAPGSRYFESAIHRMLKEQGRSVRGEWYLLDDILPIFEALHRVIAAAVDFAKDPRSRPAKESSDGTYGLEFQWCCHEDFAERDSIVGHLMRDHDLSYPRAAEMGAKFRQSPTLIGTTCNGSAENE